MRIGILALQGDIQAHARVLDRLGCSAREVRRASELDELQGLILPGGESTTMWHFLTEEGLATALRTFAAAGGALFGTCAGAILLAREVLHPPGPALGVLDIIVQRNGWGRQTMSRVETARTDDPERPQIEALLIRAPRILHAGPGVRVRAWLGDEPVWVEEGCAMATTFHPELSDDLRVHQRFLQLAAAAPQFAPDAAPGAAPHATRPTR